MTWRYRATPNTLFTSINFFNSSFRYSLQFFLATTDTNETDLDKRPDSMQHYSPACSKRRHIHRHVELARYGILSEGSILFGQSKCFISYFQETPCSPFQTSQRPHLSKGTLKCVRSLISRQARNVVNREEAGSLMRRQ